MTDAAILRWFSFPSSGGSTRRLNDTTFQTLGTPLSRLSFSHYEGICLMRRARASLISGMASSNHLI